MSKTVFNREKVDFTKSTMFFGPDQNTQRYDVFKFPVFDKLNQTMLGYFWRPEEVSLQKDRADFQQFRPEQSGQRLQAAFAHPSDERLRWRDRR